MCSRALVYFTLVNKINTNRNCIQYVVGDVISEYNEIASEKKVRAANGAINQNETIFCWLRQNSTKFD